MHIDDWWQLQTIKALQAKAAGRKPTFGTLVPFELSKAIAGRNGKC
jgi:hypothetical protein